MSKPVAVLSLAAAILFFPARTPEAEAQTVSFSAAPGGQRDHPVGTNPQVAAIGDFNGDGIADLAVSNAGSNTVSVLLGSGGGLFQAARDFRSGSRPTSVLAADLDGDGRLDLVTTNYGDAAGSVSVLRGNGDGTFAAPVDYPVGGTTPNYAVSRDFNGDGAADVAVAVFGGNDVNARTVSVLLGNGDGTLRAPALLTAQRAPLWVAAADLDADGRVDLVSANYGADSVTVFLGNGDGTFQAARSFPAGSNAAAVAAEDLNGDGVLDLAVADYGSGSGNVVSVLLGTGGGSFAAPTVNVVGFGPVDVSVSDLNADGRQDLAVANWCVAPGDCSSGTALSVLLGNGDGTFQPAQSVGAGRGVVGAVAADLNADGRPDLVAPNYAASTVSVLINTTSTPASHTLTLSRTGTGSGTVTSTPAGINCGSSCSATYNDGTPVTLSATPASGSTFTGWSGGGCSGTGTCVVAMTADTTVTASFTAEAPRYALTVSKSGNGSGSVTSDPAGIDCGSTCSASYDAGTVVTLTAWPQSGSTFAGWSGACTGSGSCSVTMSAASSVSATFAQEAQQFALSVGKTGSGSGRVTSSPAGIDCGSDCSEAYAAGTVVTLGASADAGSVFTGWGGACSGIGSCVVTMDSARSVTAAFTRAFVLSVSRSGEGSGSVASNPAGIDCGSDCSEAYESGSVVTLTAAPAAGSAFSGWSGACAGAATCSVTMNAAASVTATFTRQRFTLTVTRQGLGVGSVTSSPAGIDCGSDCSETYDSGTTVTLTPQPGLLSAFDGWGGACSGTGPCTVTMGANVTVTARFRLLGLL